MASTNATPAKIALITGASRGLGLALARALAVRGYGLVIDARDPVALGDAAEELVAQAPVRAIPGDVADPVHRERLVAAARELGGLDLLVNNASVLGPRPQPPLDRYPLGVLEHVLRVNLVAPIGLVQLALPLLAVRQGRIVNLSSDAARAAYPGWGGYGAAKAGLDHATAILAAEQPDLRIYAVDPGDMNTQLQQEAFPGEDVSDRPAPETSVPGLLRLIDGDLPSGRYEARLLAPVEAGSL
jgi:NAD(P)-dependent dehydrogenase (short-subunit alcohol dehydrogenase family)